MFIGTGTLYRIANLINTYGASAWAAFRILVLAMPSIIVVTFPMSVLLGSLMAFGRLSSSSELIVMRRGARTSPAWLCLFSSFAFFISIGTTIFNEYVVPRANNAYNTIINEEVKHNVAPATQDHIVLKNVKGANISSLMYARQYNSETKMLTDLTVQEFENDTLVRVEKAEWADWNGSKWSCTTGIIYDLFRRRRRRTDDDLRSSGPAYRAEAGPHQRVSERSR